MKNRRGKQRTERTSKHREDYWGRNSTKPLRKRGGGNKKEKQYQTDGSLLADGIKKRKNERMKNE